MKLLQSQLSADEEIDKEKGVYSIRDYLNNAAQTIASKTAVCKAK